MPFAQVTAPEEIANDRHFQESDLVVFHFGIESPLFELLPRVGDSKRKLVVFHNVTPKNVVSAEAHGTIDRSLAQMRYIAKADHVMCVSATNLGVLREAGIETPATIVPLAIAVPEAAPADKPSFADGVARLVFLGRFVRSKGPNDLLAALEKVPGPARLDLMGNKSFSDQALLAELEQKAKALVAASDGRIAIQFHYDAPEELKQRLLREADIFALPTYHEGFCVPAIEALAQGARIVTYDNSNMPAICNGFGQLVATGDLEAYGRVLAEVTGEVAATAWRQGGYAAYTEAANAYTAQFATAKIAERFVRLLEEQAGKGRL
jgi:glycosyltransferase involved in cell wall biosynthesis